MVLVAVHLDPDSLRVLGVWLSPSRSAYLQSGQHLSAQEIGREIMASKGRGASWNAWCRRLDERRTVSSIWRAVPRNDGEEPRHVLARVVAQESVSKRSAE